MANNVEVTFTICVTILVILCAGDPDLLDALTHYVMQLKTGCK